MLLIPNRIVPIIGRFVKLRRKVLRLYTLPAKMK